jgi:beta-lactamase class A
MALAAPAAAFASAAGFAGHVQTLESELGARIGVAALGLTGGDLTYRADERFPMCSTFKLLLAACVLQRVDDGRESLSHTIAYGPNDLLDHAPAARAHLAEGAMSVRDLCAAAVTLSDNTAANLLLASVGGPAAVTAYARSLGDGVTRLDRNEPTLNSAVPGDPRDTTSPRAFAEDLRRLVLGTALSPPSRALLIAWLEATQTGASRIRAGAPAGARVGDKTGTGSNGTVNDTAVVWRAGGAPMVLSVFVTGSRLETALTERAIARIAARVFATG